MHIKRFEGSTLAELLEKIRAELGEDALILETRTGKRGRVEVLAARPHASDGIAVSAADEAAGHQVLAHGAAHAYARHGGARNDRAPEMNPILRGEAAPTQTPVPGREEASASKAGSGGAISRVAQILSRKPRSDWGPNRETAPGEPLPADIYDPRAATPSAPARDMDAWRAAANAALRASGPDDVGLTEEAPHDEGQQSRIEYLGRLVRSEHFSAIPLPLRELYLDLTDAEIDSNLVFQILSKMGQARMPGQFAAAPPEQLLSLLRKLVRTGGAVQAGDPPRAIALVGPTGVGKTTTVAKIAGHAAFHLRKRVALVSTDGYRIFGAQHLASYAALMGMKFENATDTDTLRQVVSRLEEDCDLLLIDTSGRSPRDPEGIAETERLLAACPDLDIHLVLAANARVRDQALALERFSILPIRHLIFTKLDETTRRGGSFTVALKAARPVSYLGTGQEVPDDLEEATIAGLTEVIAETLQKETAHA